ncbi:MAG: ankyrin repeat domain-containing protein [Bacteriovoracaceae bacterium]
MKKLLCLTFCFLTLTAWAKTNPTENLFDAIENNDFKKAQKALDEGADPDAFDNENAPSTTAFLRAAYLNRVEMIEAMLNHKAYIDQDRPVDHHTALMIAATNNYKELAQLLVDRGASVNIETIFARTALQIAALNNSLDVAKILVLQPTMDVNHRPNLCALAVSARQGFKEMVVLLKNLKDDKAPSEQCLKRAIYLADYNQNSEIASILRQP